MFATPKLREGSTKHARCPIGDCYRNEQGSAVIRSALEVSRGPDKCLNDLYANAAN